VCNTDYKQAIGCCSTPQFSVSRWRDIQSLPSPQQPPFDVDVGRQRSSSSEGGEMETCTEHESIPPAHLLPGMCPTSRWHSAKPSETTPFAQVAPSALLRCCGNTVRLLNSGIQPGSPPPSVTERTRQLEPVIWPRQNYACKGLATPYWCDTLATTMKWYEDRCTCTKPHIARETVESGT